MTTALHEKKQPKPVQKVEPKLKPQKVTMPKQMENDFVNKICKDYDMSIEALMALSKKLKDRNEKWCEKRGIDVELFVLAGLVKGEDGARTFFSGGADWESDSKLNETKQHYDYYKTLKSEDGSRAPRDGLIGGDLSKSLEKWSGVYGNLDTDVTLAFVTMWNNTRTPFKRKFTNAAEAADWFGEQVRANPDFFSEFPGGIAGITLDTYNNLANPKAGGNLDIHKEIMGGHPEKAPEQAEAKASEPGTRMPSQEGMMKRLEDSVKKANEGEIEALRQRARAGMTLEEVPVPKEGQKFTAVMDERGLMKRLEDSAKRANERMLESLRARAGTGPKLEKVPVPREAKKKTVAERPKIPAPIMDEDEVDYKVEIKSIDKKAEIARKPVKIPAPIMDEDEVDYKVEIKGTDKYAEIKREPAKADTSFAGGAVADSSRTQAKARAAGTGESILAEVKNEFGLEEDSSRITSAKVGLAYLEGIDQRGELLAMLSNLSPKEKLIAMEYFAIHKDGFESAKDVLKPDDLTR